MPDKKPPLKDVTVNVKIKLAGLWTAVMFLYIYADIKTFFQPGMIAEIMSGEVIGITINQTFLFSAALLMSIPGIMLFLSLILKPRLNKWLNIIVSALHIALIIALQFMPAKKWAYYIWYQSLEVVFHLLIIWFAARWPREE